MPQKPKHHYIPIFYLKQWSGHGRLCEYSRPYKAVVAHKRYPSETAYQRGLNTLNSFPPEVADIVERRLFWHTDYWASRALHLMLNDNIHLLDADLRSSWVRFIISLARRNPEAIKDLYDKLGEIVSTNLSSELQDVPDAKVRQQFIEQNVAKVLQDLLNSTLIGNRFVNMIWSVVRFDNLTYPLLTSDRPFVMTNGLARPNSHIAVPISPNKCFVAAASVEEHQRLKQIDPAHWVFQNNDRMAKQARRFVYDVDDTQLRFVANRFGRMEPSYPGEPESQSKLLPK